jgi:hypothetical protein
MTFPSFLSSLIQTFSHCYFLFLTCVTHLTGFFQVLRKSLWNIIKSPNTGFWLKFEAVTHFSGNVGYTLALIVFVLSGPTVYRELFTLPLTMLGFFGVGVALLCAYITVFAKVAGSNSHYKTFAARVFRAIVIVPLTLMMGVGMCVFETYAVWDGLTSNDATFKRTPKEGRRSSVATQVAADCIDDMDDVDETEEDDSNNNDDDVVEKSAQQGQGYSKTHVRTKNQKKKKAISFCKFLSPSKHLKDALIGIAGLLLVAYLVTFFVLTLHSADAFHFTQFFMLFPVPGLLYVHGSFCLALFRLAASRWWNDLREKFSTPTATSTTTAGDSCTQAKNEIDHENDSNSGVSTKSPLDANNVSASTKSSSDDASSSSVSQSASSKAPPDMDDVSDSDSEQIDC